MGRNLDQPSPTHQRPAALEHDTARVGNTKRLVQGVESCPGPDPAVLVRREAPRAIDCEIQRGSRAAKPPLVRIQGSSQNLPQIVR